MRWLATVLLAGCLTACTKSDPLYCDSERPCAGGQRCELATRTCVGSDGGAGDGTVGKLKLGQSCSVDGVCESGLCRDGVCCENDCKGRCSNCKLTTPGRCLPTPSGVDPRGECAGKTADCGGSCDGNGACVFALPGKTCGATSCQAATLKSGQCDGSGGCTMRDQECGGYSCTPDGTQCRSSCDGPADCTGSSQCVNKQCVNSLANGAPCGNNPAACKSGNCVGGVCCDKPCSGACETCTAPGKSGSCQFKAAGTACGTKVTCQASGGGFAVHKEQCTGTSAACAAVPTQTCGNYVCATASTCATSCQTNTECVPGLCDLFDAKNTCPDTSSICYVKAGATGTGSKASPTGLPSNCVATTAPYIAIDAGNYADALSVSRKVQLVSTTMAQANIHLGQADPPVRISAIGGQATLRVTAGGNVIGYGLFFIGGSGYNVQVDGQSKLRLQRAKIYGSLDSVALYSVSSDVTLTECSLDNNKYGGIQTSGGALTMTKTAVSLNGTTAVLTQNTAIIASEVFVEDNKGYGMLLEGGSLTADRLTIRRNGSVGLQFLNPAGVVDVHNLLAAQNQTGVWWTSNCSGLCPSARLNNVTLINSTANDLECYSGSLQKLQLRNSIVAGSLVAPTCIAHYSLVSDPIFAGTGTKNVVGSPQLDASFVPSSGSPARNAGEPGASYLQPLDLAGNPRVVGSAVDLGAFELQQP